MLAAGGFDSAMQSLLNVMINVGIVVVLLSVVLCLARLVYGPTLVDRGVAADTVAVQVAGLVLLATVALDKLIAFDAVLIVSILGFVSTLAFAQFIGRRGSTQ